MTSLRSGFCVVIAILLSCHGCAPIPSKPLGSESLSPALGPHSTGEARRVVVIAAGKTPAGATEVRAGPAERARKLRHQNGKHVRRPSLQSTRLRVEMKLWFERQPWLTSL